jgi:hypothetical protein
MRNTTSLLFHLRKKYLKQARSHPRFEKDFFVFPIFPFVFPFSPISRGNIKSLAGAPFLVSTKSYWQNLLLPFFPSWNGGSKEIWSTEMEGLRRGEKEPANRQRQGGQRRRKDICSIWLK